MSKEYVECPNCRATNYDGAYGGWKCNSCMTKYCEKCHTRAEPANSVACPNCRSTSVDWSFNIIRNG